MAWLERGSRDRAARNRHPLASCRVQALLDVGFTQKKEARQTANSKRSAGSDLSYGGREPDVGSAAHPWRAEDAWFRYLGANRAALDAKRSEERRVGKEG